jgi:hypothetical protein
MMTIDQAEAELSRRIADAPFAGAWISDCERYRYALWRRWDESRRYLPIVMLNPSTADASKDDPTIRRCVGFAKRDGFGGVIVVNLFAWRATDPKALPAGLEAVGPLNESALAAVTKGRDVLCAWGAHAEQRATFVRGALESRDSRLLCLGKTASGAPRHPLYVKGDQPMVSIRGAA